KLHRSYREISDSSRSAAIAAPAWTGRSPAWRSPSRRRQGPPPAGIAGASLPSPPPVDLRPRAGADHEIVIAEFPDLPPQVLVIAERLNGIPDLLVIGVCGRGFDIDFMGCLQTCFHDRLRKRPQLRAARNQTLQGCRVAGIIPRRLLDVAEPRCRLNDGLIILRQLVPFFQIDHEVVGSATFPPTRIVVVLRNLVETQLLVVVGADPFRGIDRALLQRRIDVAAGDLLRHDAELLQCLSSPAADAEL